MTDLTVPELEQLARFDEHWRVVLADDDPLVVRELRKRGYLDVLKRRGRSIGSVRGAGRRLK